MAKLSYVLPDPPQQEQAWEEWIQKPTSADQIVRSYLQNLVFQVELMRRSMAHW